MAEGRLVLVARPSSLSLHFPPSGTPAAPPAPRWALGLLGGAEVGVLASGLQKQLDGMLLPALTPPAPWPVASPHLLTSLVTTLSSRGC